MQVRGHGHHHIAPGKGLFRRQAATGGQQLGGHLLGDGGTGRLVGLPRPLDGRLQLGRRVAGPSQFVPPAGDQVFYVVVALTVPGGPGRHRAGPVGGVRTDGGIDLGRALGVDLPGLFRDPGDGPAPQTAGRPRVGFDAVTELDRLGCPRHAPDGGGGVEVVAHQPRVQAFPASSLVVHAHKIGQKNVVVDLGVATPGRGMAGHRPGEAPGRRAHLGPAPPPALVLDDLVQVGHGGVALGVGDGVHVFCPADDPELGHRLMGADDDLEPRAQAGDETLPAERVASPAGPEHRPPLVHARFALESQKGRPRPAPRHRRLAPRRVVLLGARHRVVTPPGHGVLVVADRVEPHHPHPRHRPSPPFPSRSTGATTP